MLTGQGSTVKVEEFSVSPSLPPVVTPRIFSSALLLALCLLPGPVLPNIPGCWCLWRHGVRYMHRIKIVKGNLATTNPGHSNNLHNRRLPGEIHGCCGLHHCSKWFTDIRWVDIYTGKEKKGETLPNSSHKAVRNRGYDLCPIDNCCYLVGRAERFQSLDGCNQSFFISFHLCIPVKSTCSLSFIYFECWNLIQLWFFLWVDGL